MPFLSRLWIRLALGYLVAGSLVGAWMLAVKAGVWATPAIVRIWPIHGEVLLVGWVVQLAFGVGYWILPRYPTAPVRGGLAAPAVALAGVNLGLTGSAIGSLAAEPILMAAGRMAELVAVGAFLLHAWPRMRRGARAA